MAAAPAADTAAAETESVTENEGDASEPEEGEVPAEEAVVSAAADETQTDKKL